MRLFILIVACFLLVLVACSDRMINSADPVGALTDDGVLSSVELHEWSTFLEQRKDFRRRLRQAAEPREEIARAAAATAILLRDHSDLVSDVERRSLWRDLADRATRRTYVRELIGPQVVVDALEVRRIFDTHRDGYRKARGAKTLEIFLWAPDDLPDLRTEKRTFLDKLRAEIETADAFRKAAKDYSDATNAFRGGAIGTVLEDQVGAVLHRALFTDAEGLTDIVESSEGLFLFWVVRRVAARENTFENVAEGIEAKLRHQRMRALIAADSERLRHRHGLALITDTSPPTEGDAVLRLDGRDFGLKDLDLETWSQRAVEGRAMAMLYDGELRERGIEADRPDAIEYDWLLSQRVLARLVERAPERPKQQEERPSGQTGAPTRKVERWTFDLLTVEGVTSPETVFAVFRAQHLLGPTADLEVLRQELSDSYDLQATMRSFDSVLASSMGGLGPEIHTTIKHRLREGGMSKPMHLADRQQVVVVVLKQKVVDEKAGKATAASAAKKRSRKHLEDRIIDELLQADGFR